MFQNDGTYNIFAMARAASNDNRPLVPSAEIVHHQPCGDVEAEEMPSIVNLDNAAIGQLIKRRDGMKCIYFGQSTATPDLFPHHNYRFTAENDDGTTKFYTDVNGRWLKDEHPKDIIGLWKD